MLWFRTDARSSRLERSGEPQTLPTDVAPRPPCRSRPLWCAELWSSTTIDRFASVLRQVLLAHGWSVDEADDGALVEERLEAARYDLLMLDLYMTGMNGYEVLRRIRQPHSGVRPAWRTPPAVRIVVLSGAADQSGLAFAQRLGADACLAKPFELRGVLAAANGRA
ncbi:MAG: response regulator [Candidatus Binatia bacterium]